MRTMNRMRIRSRTFLDSLAMQHFAVGVTGLPIQALPGCARGRAHDHNGQHEQNADPSSVVRKNTVHRQFTILQRNVRKFHNRNDTSCVASRFTIASPDGSCLPAKLPDGHNAILRGIIGGRYAGSDGVATRTNRSGFEAVCVPAGRRRKALAASSLVVALRSIWLSRFC